MGKLTPFRDRQDRQGTGKFSLPVPRKLLCDNHLRLTGQAGQANVNKIVTT